jgi:hypothetical protein
MMFRIVNSEHHTRRCENLKSHKFQPVSKFTLNLLTLVKCIYRTIYLFYKQFIPLIQPHLLLNRSGLLRKCLRNVTRSICFHYCFSVTACF